MNKFINFFMVFLISMCILIQCEDAKKGKDQKPPEAPKNNEEIDGEFSKEDQEMLKKNEESFKFNVEVKRMMDIIINSLYKNKEVFIRELISNSADACDKVRFLAVQNPDYLGNLKDLKIVIEVDKEQSMFSITDTGIGMTKNDLVKNLGTIARSGTTAFTEAISKGNLNLIGQFGVGFYSAYLVSNKVVVTSKHHDDDQHVWISTAGSSFSVSKDPRNEKLGRGTKVTLFLKEDSVQYSDFETVKKNIQKYSEFIEYPIYMKYKKTYYENEEVPEEEWKKIEEEKEKKKEKDKDKDKEKDEEIDLSDEFTTDEKGKHYRKVEKWKWDYELINQNKPIWLKDKKDITEEEYINFYKVLTKDSEGPLVYDHGNFEGEVNFRYLIYIPKNRPSDLYENYYGKSSSLKLYVRRVLVADEFDDLMPKYLNFIKGIIDSDDLALNVSREQLQQMKMIKVMSNKLVKASIQALIKMSVEDSEDEEDDDDDEDDEDEEDSTKKVEKPKEEKKGENPDEETEEGEKEKTKSDRYNKFFENYGKSIKLGVKEDVQNRNKLARLLRFYSTYSIEKFTSFDDYIKRMKTNQTIIYFLAGDDKYELAKSPIIQKILKKGGEVLLLEDPIDEFILDILEEYEGKKIKNVSKGDLKLWDEDEELEKRKFRKTKKDFKKLTNYWKDLINNNLKPNLDSVIISKRLIDTPCIVSSSEHGYSSSMAKLQKAQAFNMQDKITFKFLYVKKIFEINPNHPAIKELKELVDKAEVPSKEVNDTLLLFFETAMVDSGFTLEFIHEFMGRVDDVLKFNLGLKREEKPSPYDVVLTEEDMKEEDDEDDLDEDDGLNIDDDEQDKINIKKPEKKLEKEEDDDDIVIVKKEKQKKKKNKKDKKIVKPKKHKKKDNN